MKKPLRKYALAIGATTAAVALATASPAWAHPTWTITVTGEAGPTAAITGNNVGNVTATNTTLSTSISCPVATASGTIKVGTGLTNPLASISTLSFGGAAAPHADKCNGPAGIKVKVIIDPTSLPLTMHALAHSSPTANEVTGELRGSGGGIRASIEATDGCTASVGGPDAGGAGGVIPGKITNSSDQLTTTTGGNLRVLSVDELTCDPDLINAGDLVSLAGIYGLNKNVNVTD